MCRPHSVFAVPLQRPARSSSPGVTAGAGPATDARIASIMQRIVGHVFAENAIPDVALGPGRQRADLHQAEFLVPADNRRLGAGGALVAADAGRPGVETGRHAVQHRHLAVEAATIGVVLVDRPAMNRLVLRDRKLRPLQVDDHAIALGDAITQLKRLRKLVAGVEIKDIDPRLDLRQHGDDHAAFRPQAGGHGEAREVGFHRPGENFFRRGPFQGLTLTLQPIEFLRLGDTDGCRLGRCRVRGLSGLPGLA